jgi:2-iminoacetate synthase
MLADVKTILSAKGLDRHDGEWLEKINGVRADDVGRELKRPGGKFSLQRLITFISPAATGFIEQMAQQAHELTVQRFGRVIQLYAPLYVSNFCLNSCRYCGFNKTTNFERTRLTVEQALGEADIIASEGFRHILIVSGEDPEFVTTDYLSELAAGLRKKFCSVSMEIYPMSCADYEKVFGAGIDGVALYQETYDRKTYAEYHTAGPKKDYDYRLGSAERFASAGMRRIGLGVLLGLGDWRLDTLALAEHAGCLMKKYWRGQVSFSFPRLRPALNVRHDFKNLVSDAEMVQMMLALRLCFADAGIVLSTRESAGLRDNLIKLCVTRMSAGSKTSPGGYSGTFEAVRQFEIDDTRPPAEVAEVIKHTGCEAVWKDWDAAFTR